MKNKNAFYQADSQWQSVNFDWNQRVFYGLPTDSNWYEEPNIQSFKAHWPPNIPWPPKIKENSVMLPEIETKTAGKWSLIEIP